MNSPTHEDLEQELRLRAVLTEAGPVALAFSGGVDSSYLLAVALDALGREGVLPLLGISPSVSKAQRDQANAVAAFLAVDLVTLTTLEMEREEYQANRGDRCYFCKDTLFATLSRFAGGRPLLEGTQRDDLGGHRPGLRAAAEHGVRAPLAEVGLGKAAIRRLSRARDLPSADLPSSPCLASRFPVGQTVTEEGLLRVEAAESFLHREGFTELRVRHHGDLARIEIPRVLLDRFADSDLRDRCVAQLESLGYRYVTLDLAGFRSGSSSLPPTPFST